MSAAGFGDLSDWVLLVKNRQMVVSINGGIPKIVGLYWKIRHKMDDLGGIPPQFRKPPNSECFLHHFHRTPLAPPKVSP